MLGCTKRVSCKKSIKEIKDLTFAVSVYTSSCAFCEQKESDYSKFGDS